ncbi:MAG: DoxX family protein [Ferruginibacter sp.]|nr:DoxX family protein [Ferruginibacter sp.]
MSLAKSMEKRERRGHPSWMIVFRVILGLALFLKGIQFIRDKSLIEKIEQGTAIFNEYEWLLTIIPWLHLLGGLFIVMGIFTRWAIVFQLPIVIGAIVFVNARTGIFAGSELILSIVVLSLCILFLVEGDGFLSWKKMLKKEKDIV